jgi:hypothetical protein
MSWKRTIIAGIAFLLTIMLYTLDRRLAETAIYLAINEQSLAPGINKSQVTEIRLRNRHGECVLVREGDKWQMKTPAGAQADPETVEQLLTNVTGARKRNEVEVRNLAEFGLASPDVNLSLKTADGGTFELLLGNESTYTGQVFAKLPDTNRVFTVNEFVKSALLRPPADFRRLRLVDVDIGNLKSYTAISIATAEKAVGLRNERGQWRITAPVEAPAENSVVEDFLRKTGLLRAAGFVTETSDQPTSMAAALQALSNPILSLVLERVGTQPVRLAVGQTGDKSKPVYVGRRGEEKEILILGREKLDELDLDENYFRSRAIFTLRPEDVGIFSIEIGRARTDLIHNDKGEWEFLGEPGRRVDQAQVAVRLDSLLKTRIREFIEADPRDPAVYGLQPPRYRLTVTSRDKTHTESIEAGRSETNNVTSVYARRGGDKSVFTIELSWELIILPENVADRHFARIDRQKIGNFEIELQGQKFAFRRDGVEWKILRPTQTVYVTADAAKLNRALDSINDLEFEKDFAASGDLVIAPIDKPSLTVKFYGEGNTEVSGFTVGKRLQATSFVSVGKDQTYEVRNGDLDALMATIRSLVQ